MVKQDYKQGEAFACELPRRKDLLQKKSRDQKYAFLRLVNASPNRVMFSGPIGLVLVGAIPRTKKYSHVQELLPFRDEGNLGGSFHRI